MHALDSFDGSLIDKDGSYGQYEVLLRGLVARRSSWASVRVRVRRALSFFFFRFSLCTQCT